VVCWVIAGGPVLLVAKDIVDEFGWSVHAFVGIALMIALYWTVIHLARFTFASGRNGGPDLA
jgi:hypothetical protein